MGIAELQKSGINTKDSEKHIKEEKNIRKQE